MRIVTIVPLAVALLAGCNQGNATTSAPDAKPSGQTGQRSFPLADFDRVALKGPDDVEVRVGPAFSVVASGDTGVMQALDIKRDGTALEIGRKNIGRSFNWGGEDDEPLKIVVTMPAIRGVRLAGSGDMSVDRVVGDTFDAALAGSGDLTLGGLQTKTAELSIAGSGDMKVAGVAERVKLSIAGSGDVEGAGLASRGADVAVAGSGNARLSVDGDAQVSIVGSGDVDLGAKARCRTSVTGSGDVTCGQTNGG